MSVEEKVLEIHLQSAPEPGGSVSVAGPIIIRHEDLQVAGTASAAAAAPISVQEQLGAPPNSLEDDDSEQQPSSSGAGKTTTLMQYVCASCGIFTSDYLEATVEHYRTCTGPAQTQAVTAVTQYRALEKSPQSTIGDEDPSSPRLQWTREATTRLIKLVKKYEYEFRSNSTRKKVWQSIAQEMQTEGFCLSWEHCDTKWKSLKKTYNSIKEHNANKTNKKRTWEFFKLMDESITNMPERNATPSKFASQSTVNFPKKKMKIMETFEEAEERRHQERMGNQKRFLSLLEKLVKKLD